MNHLKQHITEMLGIMTMMHREKNFKARRKTIETSSFKP